jgi:hypothetical protein
MHTLDRSQGPSADDMADLTGPLMVGTPSVLVVEDWPHIDRHPTAPDAGDSMPFDMLGGAPLSFFNAA